MASGTNPPVKYWGKIHFVGHSLGSHISAYAAYLIRESQNGEDETWIVDRITGLDPAQPCFTSADDNLKLDSSDARYVDVIHTNARSFLSLGLGMTKSLGGYTSVVLNQDSQNYIDLINFSTL